MTCATCSCSARCLGPDCLCPCHRPKVGREIEAEAERVRAARAELEAAADALLDVREHGTRRELADCYARLARARGRTP